MQLDLNASLPTLSSDLLARAVGGAPTVDAGGNVVYHSAAEADAAKRQLDRTYQGLGYDVNAASRSVARRVGNTGSFTVEAPRLDAKGTRATANVGNGLGVLPALGGGWLG